MPKLINKKQEIKKRIELINKGEVPKGYKKSSTKVFPKDWDEEKLENLCIKRTKTVRNRVLETLSISAGMGFVNQAQKFGRELSGKQYEHYIIINKGDFAYNKGNSKKYPQGCVYLLEDREVAAVPNVFNTFKLKTNCTNGYYKQLFQIGYLNQQLHKYINLGVRNDGLLNLYDSDFYSVLLPYPKLKEQEKIAEILSCCDKVIELKESLIEKTRIQNNYILECLYDSFRTNTKYSLQEIAAFRRGSFPQPYNLPEWYDEDNGKPFVQVFDIDDNYMLKKTTKTKISNLAIPKSVFVPKGSLIISIQGSIGRVAITQYDSYVDRTILIFIKFKKDIDKMFLLYALKKLFDYEKEIAPGQTIKTITKEVLSNFKIVLPSMEEQRNFAKIINQINSKINLLEQELEQYKQLKKSLSQLLLTGIVRVNEV